MIHDGPSHLILLLYPQAMWRSSPPAAGFRRVERRNPIKRLARPFSSDLAHNKVLKHNQAKYIYIYEGAETSLIDLP